MTSEPDSSPTLAALLERPVQGTNLAPAGDGPPTLGSQLSDGATLLVFLRHFG